MPDLYILAGPNGTGKTTYYNIAILSGFIEPGLSFLNADNICRDELGGYSDKNALLAAEIVRNRIKEHLALGQSFMIESNLAVQADYDWINNMKKAGYEIIVYFLCTSNVDINVGRVKRRVKEGGHDIPEAIIKQRYSSGLTYLKGKLHEFDEAILVDTSGVEPINVARITSGKIIDKVDECPKWAQDSLYIIEKLAQKP